MTISHLTSPETIDVLSGGWLRTFVLGAFGFFVLYNTWNIIHSIFFHPLSQFPGPIWSNFTRIPYWAACLSGREIRFMDRLHKKYGSVVRFSPNELSYTDAQAWRDIFSYQRGRPENIKVPGLHMFVVGTEDHARVRRLFSPGFSDRALKQQEPLFRKYVDSLMDKLRQARGQPVDMLKWANYTTFDVMAELSFGEPLGLLENSRYTDWVANLINSIQAIPILQFIKYYPWLNTCFELLEPKPVREARLANFRYSAQQVDKRLARGSEKPDLWNLLDSDGGDEKLTLEEMHANAMIFMIAGSETTATLVSAMVYLLLTNPDKLKLLQTEIRKQKAATGDLSFGSLTGLKYLNACIEEALRLYPPVPLGIPRVIMSPGGQKVCGKWLPHGTRVSVHHFAAYQSSANFKDPQLFAPERWLGDDAYRDDQRDVVQPFSFGPRNCLGQNMAYHEVRLVAGSLLSNFDLELCEESRGWINGKSYVLWEKLPLMVRLTPVEA